MVCPKCGRRTYKNETVCPKCGFQMSSQRTKTINVTQAQVRQPAPVVTSEPIVSPPGITTVTEPTPEPAPAPTPVPMRESVFEPVYAPVSEPEIANEPAEEKEDLDRTLTFAAIKEASSAETAVREYNRMKAQLRESQTFDDGSKVVLERLPEGYVYVKMPIDEADRLSRKQKLPKPLVLAVSGAAVITVFLIILLLSITGGSSKALIVGKWQGYIEPLRFGISGIPFTSVDTLWDFKDDETVTVTPQESLLAGYSLSGTYKLSQSGSDSIVSLDLSYNGERISIELIYTVDKDDGALFISNREAPAYTYTLEKVK